MAKTRKIGLNPIEIILFFSKIHQEKLVFNRVYIDLESFVNQFLIIL